MIFDQQGALLVLQQLADEIDAALLALKAGDQDNVEGALHDANQIIETLRMFILEGDDGDATDPE